MRNRSTTALPPVDLTRIGFSTSEIDTPAGCMRLFRGGKGPPIVLLHGIGGGASSYYWARLAPLLTDQFTVWAPDFIGWGDSEHPARFIEFDDYVSGISALLDQVGPARAVVGQGLAAGFAIAALMKRAASAADRLILMAPTGGRDFGKDAFDPLFAFTLSLIARWPGVNMALYRRYFHNRKAYNFWFERRGFLDAAKVPRDLVDAGFRSATRQNAAYAALPFVSGSLRYDIAPLLLQVDRPALMLWGEKETQIKPDIRQRIERINPSHITVRSIAASRTNFENEAPTATARELFTFLGCPT